jgi:hypothetical protein
MSVAELKLELYRQIDTLNENELLKLNNVVQTLTHPENEVKKTRGIIGSIPNLVVYMSDDFDEPLEDFKDYM